MSKQPKPKYKPAPTRVLVFVKVPRAVFAQYTDRLWADVLAAAEEGRDGLEVVEENYFFTGGNRPGEWAMLREAPNGYCYLFRQNWIDESNDWRWRTGIF